MKIIDCFIFYNELDMLEFRLKETNDIIDYYVLVECTKTFTNNDKPLYFNENKERFSKYLDKIIHIIVNKDIPQTSNAWDRESFQRNCIDFGIKKLFLNDLDIILISDLDEIPDSNTLGILKENTIDGIYILEQDIYFYNLYCKGLIKWHFPKILNFKHYNCLPQIIRTMTNLRIIKNGGWHLSYFGNLDFIKNKIMNFSHQEYNNDNILNNERILKQIENCDDLFGRDNKLTHNFKHTNIKDNHYLPKNFKDLI